jgi:hypothetical protein
MFPVVGGAHSDLAGTISAIFAELHPEFDQALSPDVVEQCAAQAVRDLTGSICREALPEMAVRLASVRLQTRVDSLRMVG